MEQYRPYTIRDFYFWKITICLALASFFVFASMYAVQPLLPVFVTTFGVSVSTSSLSLSLTILGLIVGLISLGFLSDRVGRTIFIRFSLIGSIIPFLIMPLSDSFLVLIVFRFIQGFALAGLPAASLAYLSEEIDQKSLGAATGFYISSNALGGMLGRVMAGYIADQYSWQTSFYLLAVIGILILIAVLIMLPKSRFFEPSNLPFRQDLSGMSYHLRNPILLLVFGLGIVLQFSFTGVWTYLPFYLQGGPFFLSITSISYMFFAYGLGVIGSPLAGWLAGQHGLERVRIFAVVILSLGILLTMIPSLTMIVIGLCIACLGFFTAHSLTATSVSETATHHKGSASSLYLVSYYIGVSFGSSFLGPVWEVFSWAGLIIVAGLLPISYVGIVQIIRNNYNHKKGEHG